MLILNATQERVNCQCFQCTHQGLGLPVLLKACVLTLPREGELSCNPYYYYLLEKTLSSRKDVVGYSLTNMNHPVQVRKKVIDRQASTKKQCQRVAVNFDL